MYVYCIIFLLLAILAVEYELKPIPKTNFLLAIIGALLVLFVAFRGIDVSRDYEPYLGSFNEIMHPSTKATISLLPNFEPAFVWIVKFCYAIFNYNAHVAVMFLFAAIGISLKLFSIRKLAFNPFLVLLLYYSHYFLVQEMTQIRNGMACSLFMLAMFYYLKNEKIVAAGLIIMAILFHNSAFFYIILFFLRRDKFNAWLYIFLFFASMVVGVLKIPFLNMLTGVDLTQVSNKLTTYVEGAEKVESVRFFNVLNICNVTLTGYLLFYCFTNKVKDVYLLFFLRCNIISLFMYGLLIDVPSVATRFAELFGVTYPFLFAYGTKLLPFRKFNICVPIAFAALYFYVDIFYGKLLMPYTFIHLR